MNFPKDVKNLIADMRAYIYSSTDVNKRVTAVLPDLCEEGDSVANCFRAESKVKSCITFQTRHMRSMFRKFPEVLCMDATYGTNANK